jgi:hypothetical protein
VLSILALLAARLLSAFHVGEDGADAAQQEISPPHAPAVASDVRAKDAEATADARLSDSVAADADRSALATGALRRLLDGISGPNADPRRVAETSVFGDASEAVLETKTVSRRDQSMPDTITGDLHVEAPKLQASTFGSHASVWAKPSPAGLSEVAPTAKSEASATKKSELAPTAKSESAPTAKSELAPSAKAELAPAAKSELAPSAKAESAPAAKSELAPTAKSELGSTAKSEATATTKTEAAPR